MIISVQKIKIFDLFFKNKQLSSKLAMSIFEFLSKFQNFIFLIKATLAHTIVLSFFLISFNQFYLKKHFLTKYYDGQMLSHPY